MADREDRAVQMLAKALEMETKGKAFYEKASSTSTNALGREIFQMLMNDEIVHMDRIRKIYELLNAGRAWSGEWKAMKVEHKDLQTLFTEMASEHGSKIKAEPSDLEALDVGIDLEQRAVAFYEENLPKATDPLEREFTERMIAEERYHYGALSDMKLYLSDPTAWFLERERGGLDGA